MKLRYLYILLSILFVLGGWLVLPSPRVTSTHEQESARERTPAPMVATVAHHVPQTTEHERSAGTSASVVSVIDGDTIEVELENGVTERVRYIGIDTPETVHPSKPVQCFGKEASARNKELVLGKAITLVRDVTDRDRYGRLLRYVYVDNVMINETLVREGYANVYTYPPDVRYDALFRTAERFAREEKKGLWSGACTSVEPTPLSTFAPESACPIKGNINTAGEKIYHLPGCKSYDKTTINESQGERWFCSEGEAQGAGWRKALNCV
jgi:micrococcal nuclease